MFNRNKYPPLKMPATHAEIVSHYIKHRRPDFACELRYFAEPIKFSEALLRAINAEHEGTRFSHQCRLGKNVIPDTRSSLISKQAQLKKVTSFAELYEVINSSMENISGAGSLYAYDTALRLGTFMKLPPEQVFLQAGTLEGAKKLLPSIRARSVDLLLFPRVFHCLAPAEMEHLLCSYRDHL
ncbi:hypothetical protein AAKU64_000566 [Undibacterium sp. GrIS 1.8]|uniref:hypothetical protein n=1 Tax=Undibacterium sp. GrIS 1.8 TaxID=3143934 RepID=UPI0033971B29